MMLIGYLIIIGLILFDQLFKILSIVLSNGSEGLIKVVIKNVFEFHYIVNPGASFGMLEGHQDLFALITIFALIVFGYLFTKIDFKKKKVFTISVILLIAGTLGNAIDRLFRGGGVVDMINMPILNDFLGVFNISSFIFNLADLYMNVAIVLFVIDILFLEGKRVDQNVETTEQSSN